MARPFREQISDYDCVPTSFINGLIHLFERKEIPPLVIQKIYLYTLDSFSKGKHSLGTTDKATELICEWLDNYRHGRFSVSAKYYQTNEVHLRNGNPISTCLNRGGAALINVNFSNAYYHCILAVRVEKDWMYCFDPLGPKRGKAGVYEILADGKDKSGANIRVNCKWLDLKSPTKKFSMGIMRERACVLLKTKGGDLALRSMKS